VKNVWFSLNKQRNVMRFMILVLVVLGSAKVQADTFYPDPSTMLSGDSYFPVMPIWWPTWFPFEEPPTPVPPVPTAMEMYMSDFAMVIRIGEEIDEINAELDLQRFLLSLDPDGLNAPMIQMSIMMFETRKASLEAERQALRNQMSATDLP
jgi:hypothetical protein